MRGPHKQGGRVGYTSVYPPSLKEISIFLPRERRARFELSFACSRIVIIGPLWLGTLIPMLINLSLISSAILLNSIRGSLSHFLLCNLFVQPLKFAHYPLRLITVNAIEIDCDTCPNDTDVFTQICRDQRLLIQPKQISPYRPYRLFL